MKNVKKRKATLVIVLLPLISMLVVACGGTKSEENASSTTDVMLEKNTEPKETPEPTIEPEIKEETIVEDKVEETIEEDPYASIDMESTLPGLEWMATFDEILTDPVVVIYNDETNKKIIVKEGDEVEFSRTKDILAFYTPDINTMPLLLTTGGFYNFWRGEEELPDAATSTRQIICQDTVITEADSIDCAFQSMYKGKTREYKFVIKFVE